MSRHTAMMVAAAVSVTAAWAVEPRTIPPERANFFDDPFVQVTKAIAQCPVPHGPEITREQMLRETPFRSERGLRCFQEGTCRLPSA